MISPFPSFGRTVVVVLFIGLSLVSPLIAGGPIQASGEIPIVYPASRIPVRYAIDPGRLGLFSPEEARDIVRFSFAMWENVETSTLSFLDLGLLDRDVNSPFDPYISGGGQFTDGIVPIILDDDGSLTDIFMGAGSSEHIFGFAGSYSPDGVYYQEGYAFLNGRTTYSRSDSVNIYRELAAHEIGHMIGLGHSQTSMGAKLSLMYPTVQVYAHPELQPDDRVALSLLYPVDGFREGTGSLSGSVRDRSGNIMSGVNVTIVDSATRIPYSTVTDYYSGSSVNFPSPPSPDGTFHFDGLPAGTYYVHVEPINTKHRGGSGLGSYRTPINQGIWREWYNASGERGEMFSDNTNEKVGVPVVVGSLTSDVAIVVNDRSSLTEHAEHHVVLDRVPVAIDLPTIRSSGKRLTRFATRFTAPVDGSVLGARLWLYALSNLPATDTLLVSVHPDVPGSLRGIPGESLGTVRISLADLLIDQENDIWLHGIGDVLNFQKGEQFHISIEVVGPGGGFLGLGFDDGANTENQSSHYREELGRWFNFPDGLEDEGDVPGWNFWMNLMYSSEPVSDVPVQDGDNGGSVCICTAFPDPASDEILLEFQPQDERQGEGELRIVNLRGETQHQMLLSRSSTDGIYRVRVDVQDWGPGLYYAVLRSSGYECVRAFRVVR